MVEWREKPDIGCMSSEGPARRREGWQKLISEHKQSGLTVKAFCQKHGVGEALFYSWRKRVAAEDQPARFALVATNRVAPGAPGYNRYNSCWPAGSVWKFHRARTKRRCGLCLGCCGNVRDSPAGQCAGLSLPDGMRHAQEL